VLAPVPLTANRTALRWRLTCHGDFFITARERALTAASGLLHRSVVSAVPRVAKTSRGRDPFHDAWAALQPERHEHRAQGGRQ